MMMVRKVAFWPGVLVGGLTTLLVLAVAGYLQISEYGPAAAILTITGATVLDRAIERRVSELSDGPESK